MSRQRTADEGRLDGIEVVHVLEHFTLDRYFDRLTPFLVRQVDVSHARRKANAPSATVLRPEQ